MNQLHPAYKTLRGPELCRPGNSWSGTGYDGGGDGGLGDSEQKYITVYGVIKCE